MSSNCLSIGSDGAWTMNIRWVEKKLLNFKEKSFLKNTKSFLYEQVVYIQSTKCMNGGNVYKSDILFILRQ